MKYLNIKKALAAWRDIQPLSEKDKDSSAAASPWTSTIIATTLRATH